MAQVFGSAVAAEMPAGCFKHLARRLYVDLASFTRFLSHSVFSEDVRPLMPPDLIPFRNFARKHVAAAKELLAGRGPHLRYACLELRLAIEALAYATLQTYLDDDSDIVQSAQSDWQPGKVLDALLDYDPMADMSFRVVMHSVAPNGEPGEMVMDAVDQRFSARWAKKAHRSMGSFLHQRTIQQVRKGKQLDEPALRREAQRVLETLEPILASPLYDTRVGFRFGYNCPGCGDELSVALMPLMLTGATRARCPTCGTRWRATSDRGSGVPRFSRLDEV